MKLAYFINYINHHRIALADELYYILHDDFVLIATMPQNVRELKGGADFSSRPYCLMAAENEESHLLAIKYACESEICSFGAGAMEYAIDRAKNGRRDGVVFEASERWLKRGWINCLSPNLIKWWWTYQTIYKKAGFYKLCSSAYAAIDHYRLHTYKNRCYKWGYFTYVDKDFDIEGTIQDRAISGIISFMWCGRFLTWKHPELPIMMAAKLKSEGYRFVLDMYGDEGNAAKHDGVYSRSRLENLIKKMGVEDCVNLCGNHPNDTILEEMRKHQIFLFTSDKNEGWGAVANEAMSNGCALVASDAIGSAPYLIRDGISGCLYKSCDANSLTSKVKWLLAHPKELVNMQRQAFLDMVNIWCPKVAAENLLQLAADLQCGKQTSIEIGPCSKAY